MWKPTEPSALFFSRQDPDDPRLGDLVRAASSAADVSADSFVIAGYPDDEGIRLNGGRPGASQAPAVVRRSFYKMTPALQSASVPAIFDFGDLDVASCSLAERHARGSAACSAVLSRGARWIGLGGGHDYGFAEAKGFLDWTESESRSRSETTRPLIINFDAHFDVRPVSKGLSSGTPFFRMLEHAKSSRVAVDFAELGIQSQCNSRKHLEWLSSRGARVLTMDDVESSRESLETCAVRVLDDWILRPRPAFLSIDIDAFSSAVAPGCSQSWATGFLPADFFPLFDLLLRRLDVRAIGIYETSPALDQDDRTSKLAALIMHRYVTRGNKP